MTKENFIHCIDEINRNSKYNIQLIYEVIYELAKDSLSYRYSIDIEEIANETLRKISRTSYIELPADQLYNLIKVVASNAANTAFNLAKRKAKFEVSESDVCYEDAEGGNSISLFDVLTSCEDEEARLLDNMEINAIALRAALNREYWKLFFLYSFKKSDFSGKKVVQRAEFFKVLFPVLTEVFSNAYHDDRNVVRTKLEEFYDGLDLYVNIQKIVEQKENNLKRIRKTKSAVHELGSIL